MRVFCDFDGTISQVDTTDFVLTALAGPAWREVEAQWETGEITAAECMRTQIGMIQGSDADLDAVLDRVTLDPAFVDFVVWAEAEGLDVTILSDGVDYFIRRLLTRMGLGRLPVIANTLAGEAGQRQLEQPWIRAGCAGGSGVCKCDAARAVPFRDETIVFVGDGRSDFCVSRRVDILFAKDRLAEYSTARGRAYFPFESFADVTATLTRLRSAEAQAVAV